MPSVKAPFAGRRGLFGASAPGRGWGAGAEGGGGRAAARYAPSERSLESRQSGRAASARRVRGYVTCRTFFFNMLKTDHTVLKTF